VLQYLYQAGAAMTETIAGTGLPAPESRVPTKACIVCGEPIPRSAKLCTHCKSNQAAWRNEVQYWAGVAGLFTVIATGLTFTTNIALQLWQRIFGQEISIANLDPFGRTVAWNVTQSPISVRLIKIISEAPKYDLVWDVFQLVEPNKELLVGPKRESPLELQGIAKSWQGLLRDMFGREPGPYALLDANTLVEVKKNWHTDKYVPTFLMPDSETYEEARRFLKTELQTFECKATVTFQRMADGSSGSVEVPCKGTFRFRSQL
jgi:predicted nucleic acid-binding Zn ribbon protein